MSKRGIFTLTGVLAILVAAALLFSAVGSTPAEAARGGKGKGAGGGNTTTPTVTMAVSPNPPTGGQAFIVSGTGFTPGAPVNFVLGGYASYAMADQTGYAWETWTIALPGTYTITAKEYTSKGWVQVGSITFNVV